MPDALPAFEHLWATLEAERAAWEKAKPAYRQRIEDNDATLHAVKSNVQDALDALAASKHGPPITQDMIRAAAARARRRFRRSRITDALRGRPAPTIPECAHDDVVEVVSAGEVVAGLCQGCGEQLTAAWLTCQHQCVDRPYVDPEAISWPEIGHSVRLAIHQCPDCETTWWQPVTIAEWVRWL
ncbi:hypothetical protein FH608_046265 [Nonomuraea phyllanthi]|uniref:Uncharacterized protein n=1 Tax=Nonomuraea phyllanthi TaxID=2219224 RepID=A0A5C4V679_9ACTN|nr:hypothetical protein [Nonomuraea phyllanthi]KAB8186900.1 hypothetical protein FH608_046265 [Nonomuraea phyllanthi]